MKLQLLPIDSDPDVDVGGFLTLERADGRSVWRQRFRVKSREASEYVLEPCDVV